MTMLVAWLALGEFVGVGDKFGIGAGAEFVEVEALAFALRVDAMRHQKSQDEIEHVGERKDKAEQGTDADDLSHQLTIITGESLKDAEREQTPQSADGMNRD